MLGAKIAEREFEKGLAFCGTGMGIHVAAGKVPHVHAAVCESVPAARRCTTGNNCNVLAMGAFFIGPRLGMAMADAFLDHSFGEGYEDWPGFDEYHVVGYEETEHFDYEAYKALNGFRLADDVLLLGPPPRVCLLELVIAPGPPRAAQSSGEGGRARVACLLHVLEVRRLVRATGGIAGAVGVRLRRPACRPRRSGTSRGSAALQTSIPGSRAPRRHSAPAPTARSRDVRRHAVMRHRAPGMILGARLREPDIAGVPGQLPALSARTMASRSQILPRAVFTRYAPRFILAISASLNMCSVSGCSGAVDRDHVADADHRLDGGVEGQAELLLDRLWQPVAVGVVQLHVERLEALQHGGADAPRGDRADAHAFQVV